MAESSGPEPSYALPEEFVYGDKLITVDPGYPYCVANPNETVKRGAAVHWRSVHGDEFEIRFQGGAPCTNWSSDWRNSQNGQLVCAIPRNATTGGYKYDVRIGDCESDPIVWVAS